MLNAKTPSRIILGVVLGKTFSLFVKKHTLFYSSYQAQGKPRA